MDEAVARSIARWPKWPQMQDMNARVERLSQDEEWVIYLDTATPILGEDGKPRRELFLDDGLHLNDAGYKLWTELLAPAMAKAANEWHGARTSWRK